MICSFAYLEMNSEDYSMKRTFFLSINLLLARFEFLIAVFQSAVGYVITRQLRPCDT